MFKNLKIIYKIIINYEHNCICDLDSYETNILYTNKLFKTMYIIKQYPASKTLILQPLRLII